MSTRARGVLVVLVVLVGVAVGGALWFARASSDSAASARGTSSGTSSGTPSAAATATNTSALPTAVTPPPDGGPVATDKPAPTSGGSVSVLLTYAGWEAPPGVSAVDGKSGAVQVNGLISGVIENGGACRVTLTSGSVTVSGQSAGVADAKSTDCSVRVTDAALTPGTWKAVLTYQSATSRGSSAPLDVQVAAR